MMLAAWAVLEYHDVRG
ncbi:TPA: hypothetical protein ANIA_11507 [Aspergillus nidulans FGSC A4]|uniref:Uncharacterized protein n=1 Tax=Emericella nidulans (strain FGSC A4 / ATCC 38163 / CBS 112.46 / NRRL 194 / M139) TaxID=227321 RepID=C8V177_EMENI|nr:TPA: hypothetical protein ANIA_11507 [Aspergillus nidulans FGSC A4]